MLYHPNCVAYFPVENDSWADKSGAGNDGTATSMSYVDFTRFGRAGDFDGTNSKVTVADSASTSITGAQSCFCWINLDTVSARQTLIQKVSYSGGPPRDVVSAIEYQFFVDATGVLTVAIGGGGTVYIGRSGGTLSATTDYHVGFTYDNSGACAGIKLYVNAVQTDTTNFSSGSFSSRPDTTAATIIGMGGVHAASDPVNGRLSEITLWNVAVPASDVGGLMLDTQPISI